MRQSFQEWEWLIVNDASTRPEALAVLDAYRQADARIRVIDLPTNQGPSAARNLAFREARAPYVVQLDSDNLLSRRRLKNGCGSWNPTRNMPCQRLFGRF